MELEIRLKNGMTMPRLGMGTWYLGEDKNSEEEELNAIRAGLDAGMNLIDTAEMYGNGAAERLVGKALEGRKRDELFIVSKVECMEELVKSGKIRAWGVSNFDTDDLEELYKVRNGNHCVVNQDLYHLGSRGIEYDVLPWQKKNEIALMAYCPLAQGGELRRELLSSDAVRTVAASHGISEIQVLLAFVLNEESAVAIPRSSRAEHVLMNWETRKVKLTNEDIELLNKAFPKPKYKLPLDIV